MLYPRTDSLPRTKAALLALATLAAMLAAHPPAAEASSQTCSGNVCIALTGTGLTVDQWRTTGSYSSSYRCAHAYFYVNGGLYRIVERCGTGTLSASLYNRTFPDGSRVCNSWAGLTGQPCLTVHD